MKKKNLTGLALRKYSISNLALLHKKIGGNIETNTELVTTSPNNVFSLHNECTIISDCTTSDIDTCNCNTNNGTVKAQPPTQHKECPTNNNSDIIY